MTVEEKLRVIAKTLAFYYHVPEPDCDSTEEYRHWIKTVLNKSNAHLKKCPHCQQVMVRKPVNGKLRYLCKNCNKTFVPGRVNNG